MLDMVGRLEIALIKIDIEGAEFELFESLDLDVLSRVRQLLVEFHHDIVSGVTWSDTQAVVNRIKSSGMKARIYNGRDCLFYW